MELGSWSLIQAPTLLSLIPLLVMIVMSFKGKNNISAIYVGIVVAALMMGQDLKLLANAFSSAMSSSSALIGTIIMMGAGLGALMTKAGVTQTLVYWIVKKIGVNTQTKAKISLIVVSILVCGLLGTLGGGNAVIAPIMLPIMASLGITPTVVAALFKTAGEIGLILGPLTGVTLITMEVTGMTYGALMLKAALPFAAFWVVGTWIGCNRAQKLTEGKEFFSMSDDVKSLEDYKPNAKDTRTAIIFMVAFVGMIVYGFLKGAGTSYALIVMLALAVVLTIASWTEIDEAVNSFCKGLASMSHMFLLFIGIEVLLDYVTLGGGFDALSDMISGLIQGGGATGVMLAASVVGGFGIEAAAVAEIKIIAEMFGGMMADAGASMALLAVPILAATRLTGSMYPTSNFAGQMGTAQCTNMKGALQALWFGVGFAWVFVAAYAFVAPMIFG